MNDGPILALVPLAGQAGGTGAVVEISCDRADRPEPAPAGLDPRVAALAYANLTPAARVAIDVLNMLRLDSRRTLWRWPRLTGVRDRRARLAPGNSTKAGKLARENTASAEVGIALGLLAVERCGTVTAFAATGTLAFRDRGRAMRQTGPIGPVGGIPEKLAAIGDWLADHAGSQGRSRLPVFLPVETEDGRPIDEAHAAEIAALVERGRAFGITVEPRPVASLAEAAEAIGATRRPRLDAREVGAWSGVAAMAAVLLFLTWSLVPTRLDAAPIPLGPDLAYETPRAFRQFDNQRRTPLEICRSGPGARSCRGGGGNWKAA